MKILRKEYQRPSEGLHTARIAKIEDLGVQHSAFGDQDRLRIDWEVEDERNKDGNPLQIASWFNKSIGQKSKFGPFVCTVLGKWPESGFDTDRLIGKWARIFVKHVVRSDGGNGAKVTEILKPLNQQGVDVTDADVEFPSDQMEA